MRDDTPAVPVGPASPSCVGAIDVATFTQLVSAIQQSGFSLNVEAIHSACDREFRVGRYQRAFDVVEGVYVQLNAQMMRRQSELRQQEMQYKSGSLKMSPKDWLQRQRVETERTQRIERARRQCVRVLDGLNTLRAAHTECAVVETKEPEKTADESPS